MTKYYPMIREDQFIDGSGANAVVAYIVIGGEYTISEGEHTGACAGKVVCISGYLKQAV